MCELQFPRDLSKTTQDSENWCVLCSYLAIFGVNVQHLLISFSSVAVAFAFVFGNSLREVYESVVWLFVVNPYDEGEHLSFPFTACISILSNKAAR